jgi:hypothetical protein
LERATFNVIGSAAAGDFLLEVGLDGSLGGHLQVTVSMKGDRVAFNFGIDGTPTNPSPVRQVLDALKKDDLFAVYYDSGHVVGPHGIGRRNVNSAPFANWRFHDFSGFRITAEKPTNSPKPDPVHDLGTESEWGSLSRSRLADYPVGDAS